MECLRRSRNLNGLDTSQDHDIYEMSPREKLKCVIYDRLHYKGLGERVLQWADDCGIRTR
jgi:hypothetical protein